MFDAMAFVGSRGSGNKWAVLRGESESDPSPQTEVISTAKPSRLTLPIKALFMSSAAQQPFMFGPCDQFERSVDAEDLHDHVLVRLHRPGG